MTDAMLPVGKYRVVRVVTRDEEVKFSHPFVLLRAFPTGTGIKQFTMDVLAFMGDEDEQESRGTKDNTQ